MNLRIRNSGGIVYFTPDLTVTYRPRNSIKALARQYFDYGRWRREVARRHPETLSLRYLAAPMTVGAVAGGLGVCIVGVVTGRSGLVIAGVAPATVYAVGNLVASASVASQSANSSLMRRLPAVFATMHGAWGAGFLRGGAGR